VTIKVYNMLGQLVTTLVDDLQSAGQKSVVWNGTNDVGAGVSSGIYILRMTAGGFVETKRMLLIK
jgi:flagellar hook assembly protein FlgD